MFLTHKYQVVFTMIAEVRAVVWKLKRFAEVTNQPPNNQHYFPLDLFARRCRGNQAWLFFPANSTVIGLYKGLCAVFIGGFITRLFISTQKSPFAVSELIYNFKFQIKHDFTVLGLFLALFLFSFFLVIFFCSFLSRLLYCIFVPLLMFSLLLSFPKSLLLCLL